MSLQEKTLDDLQLRMIRLRCPTLVNFAFLVVLFLRPRVQVTKPENIAVSAVHQASLDKLKPTGVRTTDSNAEVCCASRALQRISTGMLQQ